MKLKELNVFLYWNMNFLSRESNTPYRKIPVDINNPKSKIRILKHENIIAQDIGFFGIIDLCPPQSLHFEAVDANERLVRYHIPIHLENDEIRRILNYIMQFWVDANSNKVGMLASCLREGQEDKILTLNENFYAYEFRVYFFTN